MPRQSPSYTRQDVPEMPRVLTLTQDGRLACPVDQADTPVAWDLTTGIFYTSAIMSACSVGLVRLSAAKFLYREAHLVHLWLLTDYGRDQLTEYRSLGRAA